MNHHDRLSRRTLLHLAAAGAGAAVATRSLASERTPPFRDVGRKFSADGRVLPFAGNTIVCHLPQQGEDSGIFEAMLDIYRELPRTVFFKKVAPLPPSSYHMTIFGGADSENRKPSAWPKGVPIDAPIAECDRILAGRLAGLRLGADAAPYRMRIDLAEPLGRERPLAIKVVPRDAAEDARLRRLRRRLAEVLGFEAPTPDLFEFHITIAYQLAPLTDDETVAFLRGLARWRAMIARRCPTIVLGAPEYCLFDDMFSYRRQFFLD